MSAHDMVGTSSAVRLVAVHTLANPISPDTLLSGSAALLVFDRPRSRLFRPEFVERSQRFYDRFGARTILVGRFVPVVRTVATVMAGVGRMPFRRYAGYSAVGGIIWADGMLLLGLGHVDFVRRNRG